MRPLFRPTLIRVPPPRLIINKNPVIKVEPVRVQAVTPISESSIESSLTTFSSISSTDEEIETKKKCFHCLPCCRTKGKDSIPNSQRIDNRPVHNYPNFKLKTRTIYIILILLFILFLVVIVLLIVLIVVRR